MKKLLVGVALAAGMVLAMAPPALASPQLQVEKFKSPDVAIALVDHQVIAPSLELDKIAPVADKAAGKKKTNDKNDGGQAGGKTNRAAVAYHLRL